MLRSLARKLRPRKGIYDTDVIVPFNVMVDVTHPRFGAVGDYTNSGTGTDDTKAIKAAENYLLSNYGGGTLWFPPRNGTYYKTTQGLTPNTGLRIAGANCNASKIFCTSGSLFSIGSGSYFRLRFTNIGLFTSGSHLFDLGTGDLYQCLFDGCHFYTVADGSSVFFQNGNGNFLGNTFLNCIWEHNQTATVPTIYMRNGGGACNGNKWLQNTWYGHGCTNVPFWHVENTATGNNAYDNELNGITGENNPGGLVKALTHNNLRLVQVNDYDATTNYTADIINVGKSATSSTQSGNIYIEGCGAKRQAGTLNGGVFDINVSSLTTKVTIVNPSTWPATPSLSTPTVAAGNCTILP